MKARALMVGLLLAGMVAPALADSNRRQDIARIQDARTALLEIMGAPDKSIPRELFESAECLAIVPGEKRLAFIFGGRYGKGLVTCRNGQGWTAPAFLMLGGGSFGFQIGGSSTDIVMIFRNHDGLNRLLSDKFTVGADASAAAGPVGRNAAAATDAEMHAEILTYARSRGAFAGVSLSGTMVKPDRSGDEAMYGIHVRHKEILEGRVEVPAVARDLIETIGRLTRGDRRN
jgi:SH3 domain-containing YSC84-like protein 1